jgi:broad specificity phosphatase PhoE
LKSFEQNLNEVGETIGMSTLYLIRHGQASFGALDYDDLSARGRHQASLLGASFLKAGMRFDACWSGTLRRQQQTAGEVGERYREAGLDMPAPTETRAFNEYDYEAVLRALVPLIVKEDPAFIHDVDNMLAHRRGFQKVFGRVMARWASGRDRMDGLPTWLAFCERVNTGIREITNGGGSGRCVAVFTSGGPIAAAVGNALDLDPEKAVGLSWQVVNASVTRFKFSPGRISLDTFNEYGHLEKPGNDRLVTYR